VIEMTSPAEDPFVLAPSQPASVPPEPPLSRWQRFKLVVKVIELRLRFIVLMAVTGLVFGYWDTIVNHYQKWTRPPGERLVAAADIEFFCPMHPNVVQEAPGSCPICGMPLSKRKKGEPETLPPGVTARLNLSPSRVRQAGVETIAVAYRPLDETVTTVGSVTFDERRLARISSKIKGMARVETLHVNFNGTAVRAGEPLAELYSPELYQAVRELLLAQQSARDRSRAQTPAARALLGSPDDLVALARQKLALWGITPKQVDEILQKGQAEVTLPILAPISGVVVRKNVVEGQYVTEGEAMFEVADLSHVWIQAQVYEDQIPLVQVGQAVEAKVEAFPGEVFPGTVAFKAPTLNPATRTLNVRYDLANADGKLQPGMFATVTLRSPVAQTPAFRSRLARAAPDRDRVRTASLTVDEQKICPVTTLKLGAMGDPVPVEVEGRKIWTCCGACEPKLAAQPARYLARLEPAPRDQVLAVPESAVIDTGTRTLVFVESDPGVFEAREVVLGPESNGLYPVLEGLAVGENVVAAGSFLLDAETRLKATAGPAPVPDDRPLAARRPPAEGVGHRH
jgi:Cu(I)/Ag(I) efflux system membrane fusion protein